MSKTVLLGVGAFLFVAGCALVGIGAGFIPGMIARAVESGIQNHEVFSAKGASLTETTAADSVSNSTSIFYVYNVTNAADVLTGSKPILDEVKIETTKTSVKYNYKFDSENDAYGYSSYDYYTAKEGYDMDEKFVSLNMVYFGAAIGQGGSEVGFGSLMLPTVLDTVITGLTSPQSVYTGPNASVPIVSVASISMSFASSLDSSEKADLETVACNEYALANNVPQSTLSCNATASSSRRLLTVEYGLDVIATAATANTIKANGPASVDGLGSAIVASAGSAGAPVPDEVTVVPKASDEITVPSDGLVPGLRMGSVAMYLAQNLGGLTDTAAGAAIFTDAEDGTAGYSALFDNQTTEFYLLESVAGISQDFSTLRMPGLPIVAASVILDPDPDAPLSVGNAASMQQFMRVAALVSEDPEGADVVFDIVADIVDQGWTEEVHVSMTPLTLSQVLPAMTSYNDSDFLKGIRMGAIAQYVGFFLGGCNMTNIADCVLTVTGDEGYDPADLMTLSTLDQQGFIGALVASGYDFDYDHLVMHGVDPLALLSQPSTLLDTNTSAPLGIANAESMISFYTLAVLSAIADPSVQGFYDTAITPLVEAAWTADAQRSMAFVTLGKVIPAITGLDSQFIYGLRAIATASLLGFWLTACQDPTVCLAAAIDQGIDKSAIQADLTTPASDLIAALGLDISKYIVVGSGGVPTSASLVYFSIAMATPYLSNFLTLFLTFVEFGSSVAENYFDSWIDAVDADLVNSGATPGAMDYGNAMIFGEYLVLGATDSTDLQAEVDLLYFGYSATLAGLDTAVTTWQEVAWGQMVEASGTRIVNSTYLSANLLSGDNVTAAPEFFGWQVYVKGLSSAFVITSADFQALVGYILTYPEELTDMCTNDATTIWATLGLTLEASEEELIIEYFCDYLPMLATGPDEGHGVFDLNTSIALGNFFMARLTDDTAEANELLSWYQAMQFASVADFGALDADEIARANSYVPSTWEEAGWLQLATGGPTRFINENYTSAYHLSGDDLSTVPEFYAWQREVKSIPSADVLMPTISQAQFLYSAAVNNSFDLCANETTSVFSNANIPAQDSSTYIEYFCDYLPYLATGGRRLLDVASGGDATFDLNTSVAIGEFFNLRMDDSTPEAQALLNWYRLGTFAHELDATAMSTNSSAEVARVQAYVPADWEEVGYLQWCTGTPTLMIGAEFYSSSHLSGGDLAQVPEFYAWQKGVAGVPDNEIVKLTISQSKQLLTFLHESAANSAAFCLGVLDATGVFNTGFPNAAAMGVTAESAQLLFNYFCKYAPEVLALKGQFFTHPDLARTDGTLPNNAGVFSRLSLREMLHGYRDELQFALTGGLHGGILGNEVLVTPSVSDSDDANMMWNAGNTDYKKIDQIVRYNDHVELHEITDLGGTCPDPTIWASDPIAAACHLWDSVETIEGAPSSTRFAPLSEGDMPATHAPFIGAFKRSLMFEKGDKVEVEGVACTRYNLDSDWLGQDSATGVFAERAVKYGTEDDGFLNLGRSLGMAPVYVGAPKHYLNPDERAKLDGLTEDDWAAPANGDDLNMFLDAEPLSGQVMNGAQRFGFNIKVEPARMNGMHQSMYPANEHTHMYFPILWMEELASIPAADAAAFVDSVYGGRAKGKTIMIVMIAAGAVAIVAALGMIVLGIKQGSKVTPETS